MKSENNMKDRVLKYPPTRVREGFITEMKREGKENYFPSEYVMYIRDWYMEYVKEAVNELYYKLDQLRRTANIDDIEPRDVEELINYLKEEVIGDFEK